eukprot:2618762-Pyramimonas_sp.AAC.1
MLEYCVSVPNRLGDQLADARYRKNKLEQLLRDTINKRKELEMKEIELEDQIQDARSMEQDLKQQQQEEELVQEHGPQRGSMRHVQMEVQEGGFADGPPTRR